MSFANHNILDIALSIIPPTVVQIRKAIEVSVNDYAQADASYGEWREVYGIVQPGSESNEHTQGIDFSKKHVKIWLRGVDLTGTHIQEAPDQIRYLGHIYNVIFVDDWFPYDNYRMCECVEALNLGASQKGAKAQVRINRKTSARRYKSASGQVVPDSGNTEAKPHSQTETTKEVAIKEPSTSPQEAKPLPKPTSPSVGIAKKPAIRF